MNIKTITLLAAGAAMLAGSATAEAAQLTVVNTRGHTIHLVAVREGHGDKYGLGTDYRRMWRGHRAYNELNRRLDLGHLHAGERKTFDLESGNWTVSAETSHRRTETAQVHLHHHQGEIVKFQ
jgi:hypothetical protein